VHREKRCGDGKTRRGGASRGGKRKADRIFSVNITFNYWNRLDLIILLPTC